MDDTPKILFVTRSPPYPTSIGGNQRSNLLYRVLSRSGDTDLLVSTPLPSLASEQLDRLREGYGLKGVIRAPSAAASGMWKLLRPWRPAFVDRLAHHLRGAGWTCRTDPATRRQVRAAVQVDRYDLVVGTPPAVLAQGGFLDHPCVVVDTHDLPAEYYSSRLAAARAPLLQRFLLARHLKQLRGVLPTIFSECRLKFVAKEQDCNFPGLSDAVVLPNVPFPAETDDSTGVKANTSAGGRHVLFLAAFTHQPNIDGAEFLIDDVWPRVRKVLPDAKLVIAGSGIPSELADHWREIAGVDVRGYVEDLGTLYAEAALTVVPIFWGAGTNIKVVESLARGRTCIVSPFGHRGYENVLKDGECLRVAGAVTEFAASCVDLLKNPERRESMARRGRGIVEESFTVQRFSRIVEGALAPLLASRQNGIQDE